MDYGSLIVGVLEEIASLASGVTSGQVQSILNIISKALPVALETEQALLQPIKNIIASLQGSGALTVEQVQQLQQQSDAIDAELDAAAKDDGLV